MRNNPENVDAARMRGTTRPPAPRPDPDGGPRAGRGGGPPPGLSRGRRAPNFDEPGLQEALAAYMRLMDEVVTESQYCKSTNRGDPDREAYLGDIIERAAARRRERNGLRVDGA